MRSKKNKRMRSKKNKRMRSKKNKSIGGAGLFQKNKLEERGDKLCKSLSRNEHFNRTSTVPCRANRGAPWSDGYQIEVTQSRDVVLLTCDVAITKNHTR